MRIKAKFACGSVLFASFVPALLGQTPSKPASAVPSASGQPPASQRSISPPAETPAMPPQVTFHDGLIQYPRRKLHVGDVLRAVQNATGATIESPGLNERASLRQVRPRGAARGFGFAAERLALWLHIARFAATAECRHPGHADAAKFKRGTGYIPRLRDQLLPSLRRRPTTTIRIPPITLPDRQAAPRRFSQTSRLRGSTPQQQNADANQPQTGPKTPEQLLRELQQLRQQQQQQFQLQ